MIGAVSHLCFRVANLDVSVDFYVTKLGLKHAFDFRRDDGTRFGAYVYCGNRTFIELFERPKDAAAPAQQHSYQHVCFEVDSMEKTIAMLRAAAVDVGNSILGGDGNPQAWMSDPDGNRIELHELRPDGWQLAALKRLESGE